MEIALLCCDVILSKLSSEFAYMTGDNQHVRVLLVTLSRFKVPAIHIAPRSLEQGNRSVWLPKELSLSHTTDLTSFASSSFVVVGYYFV